MKYISQTTHQHGEFHHRCLALLLGSPPQESGSITGYATFKKVGQHSEYIFVPGTHNKRAKSGKYAVEGTIEYSVLARKHGCSLVEFGVNKFARHLPRLAFSHLMCPILGDPLYTQRIVEIDGSPVLVAPGQGQKKTKQWFPTDTIQRLNMSASDLRKSMPLYCHVYQTAFPRFGWAIGRPVREQDTVDLLASIPPPTHFLAMAEALDMDKVLAAYLRGDGDERQHGNVTGEIAFR